MKTPDINALVAGVLAIVGIAFALGRYDKLEAWARRQAMEAMLWNRGLPHFFAAPTRHRAGARSRGASYPPAAATGDRY